MKKCNNCGSNDIDYQDPPDIYYRVCLGCGSTDVKDINDCKICGVDLSQIDEHTDEDCESYARMMRNYYNIVG